MKTEVYIYNLNGNRAEVRNYAKTIASMDYNVCNAYVMAFDEDNEISWTIQAGDDLDEVKASINWQGVRRVEIYDHSFDGSYKVEHVYVTSQKSLNRYTIERSADDYDVKSNTTPYTADNWQTSDNSDTHNSNSDTPTDPTAEPSHLAQVASVSFAMITTDKIKYNIGDYLWNYWQNNHDIESIRNAEKTLRSEIEMGLRRQYNDFCEYQLLCNKLGIENKLNIKE